MDIGRNRISVAIQLQPQRHSKQAEQLLSMRRVSHLTPRYVVDRLGEMIYHRLNPNEPWLTHEANTALASLLKPTDVGIEFGSGRSTAWLAKRIKHLTSVEDNGAWHARVAKMLAEQDCSNVRYLLRHADADGAPIAGDPYVSVAAETSDDSLDFALIDGKRRDACAWLVIPKLHPGSLLVIDNVNRYLPSDSIAPNSRSKFDNPSSALWRKVYSILRDWRVLWTSSGVTDTAIFFKP